MRWQPLLLCLALSAPGALNAQSQPIDFAFPELSGEASVSLSDYRGKLVYVDIWASWCKPCRESTPWLAELHRRLAGEHFDILAVTLDRNASTALKFLERYPVPYTVLIDAEGDLLQQFDLIGMPTGLLVSPEGELLWRHSGFRLGDTERIRKKVLESLATFD